MGGIGQLKSVLKALAKAACLGEIRGQTGIDLQQINHGLQLKLGADDHNPLDINHVEILVSIPVQKIYDITDIIKRHMEPKETTADEKPTERDTLETD